MMSNVYTKNGIQYPTRCVREKTLNIRKQLAELSQLSNNIGHGLTVYLPALGKKNK